MTYKNITVPVSGSPITIENNELNVPNNPIITYIEGDGIGIDISPVMLDVVNTAVKKAYGGEREIHWMEIYAGEKADSIYGEYLPEETVEAIKEFSVSIKGPLTTPVGGGMRSLNVAIRQILDLYICQRPVQYFTEWTVIGLYPLLLLHDSPDKIQLLISLLQKEQNIVSPSS